MIILVTGPTGAGKDFIVGKLKDMLKAERIIRPTTRPMRSVKELVYYKFYNEEEYDKLALFDTKTFRGWRYGFYSDIEDKSKSKDIYVASVDAKTGELLQKKLGRSSVRLVYVDANMDTRIERCFDRESGLDTDELRRRMMSDTKDNQDIDMSKFFYFENNETSDKVITSNLNKLIEQILEENKLDSKLIDEKGRIKKGEIMKNALEKAPSLEEKDIKKVLVEYFNKNKMKYIGLNSRDINYMQLFINDKKDSNLIADYIIDFLKESSFVTNSEDAVLVPTNNMQYHSMIDIKDIFIKDNAVEIYIDGIFFNLYNAEFQIETIK